MLCHLDIALDVHMSSINYEEIDYGLDLESLAISHLSRVSNPKRSELVRNSNHLTPHVHIYIGCRKGVKSIKQCPLENIRRCLL